MEWWSELSFEAGVTIITGDRMLLCVRLMKLETGRAGRAGLAGVTGRCLARFKQLIALVSFGPLS